MDHDEFSYGDYVAVMEPNGRLRAHGTVTGATYLGYWVKFPNGASALIPSERLSLALKVSVDPRDVVSVPTDKVTAARQEYDRLKQEQEEIDRRRDELQTEQDIAMRRTSTIRSDIRNLKDQRRGNSERMTQLKTFLEFAETI